MKSLLLALLFLYFGQLAIADVYVSPLGDNTTGADWNHAYNQFASAQTIAVRGTDIIRFAANAAGYSPFVITKAVSGTSRLILRAATIADHGTNTGWSNSLAVDNGLGTATTPAYIHSTICTNEIQVLTSYVTIDGQIGQNNGAKGFSLLSDCPLTSTLNGHIRIGDGTGRNIISVIINYTEVNDQMTEVWYQANKAVATAHNIFYVVLDTITGLFLNWNHFHNVTRDVFDLVGCDMTLPVSIQGCGSLGVSQSINDVELYHNQFDHNRSSTNHGQLIQANNVNTLISAYNTNWDIEGTGYELCLTHRCSDYKITGNFYVNDATYNDPSHTGISKSVGDNYSGSDLAHSYTALNGLVWANNTVLNVFPINSTIGVVNGTASWKGNTAYGGTSQPYSIIFNGFVQGATTAGTTSNLIPAFSNTPGNTVVDGTVTWTNLGAASTSPDVRNNVIYGSAKTWITGSTHDFNDILNGALALGVGFTLSSHETNTASGSVCPFTSGCAIGTLDATLTSDTTTLSILPDTGAWDSASPLNTTPFNSDSNGVTRTTSRGVYQFVAAGNQLLTVAGLGNANGTICSDGAACVDGIINCISTAGVLTGICTHSFTAGTSVTLTATATSGNFTTWSGACSGSSTCTLIMSVPFLVNATFQATVSCTLSFSSNSVNVPNPITATITTSGLTGNNWFWTIIDPFNVNLGLCNTAGCQAGLSGNLLYTSSGKYTCIACSNGNCTGPTQPLNVNNIGIGGFGH